jgi:glycosyltransferase involved in cell wall biosynthesis
MGCYAEIVRAQQAGAPGQPPLPPDTGWVVLTTGTLSPRQARALFPAAARLLVLGTLPPRAAAQGVSFARIEPGPPPSIASATLAGLRGQFTHALLLDGLQGVSGRVLLQLSRHGVRQLAWRDGGQWHLAATRRVAWGKPLARLAGQWRRSGPFAWYRRRVLRARAHLALQERNTLSFPGEGEWRAHLARPRPGPGRRAGARRSVLLYIGQLNSGGAERQLCNLALALRRRGDAVRVLTTYPLADEDAHYLHLLRDGAVPVSVAGMVERRGVAARLRALELRPDLVGALPDVLRSPVLDLCGELLADPPDVLHCWLDYPNIAGAAAAVLAGTPHVLLSTRNVNPTHFPSFYQPWMDGWYAFLATLPQVHFCANSEQGAGDYARWLGLPGERFAVIRNGVDLAALQRPRADEAARLRARLAPGGAPLLLGVFRLAPEKQPSLFLEVVARVRASLPGLRVALAGVGPLQADVEAGIRARGLQDTVTLLGQRRDVPALLAAADALLLTSAVEGTPNVLLEAQWLQCPPVATAVGGAPDAVADLSTGFLHASDDAEGLARSVLALLTDPVRRAEMGRAGHAFVRERFGLQRMLDETLRHYDRLAGREAPGAGAADMPWDRTADLSGARAADVSGAHAADVSGAHAAEVPGSRPADSPAEAGATPSAVAPARGRREPEATAS